MEDDGADGRAGGGAARYIKRSTGLTAFNAVLLFLLLKWMTLAAQIIYIFMGVVHGAHPR